MSRIRTSYLRFAAFAAALLLSGCAVWDLPQSRELVRKSEPYQQAPAGATGGLLVVGDSTAVGTGASAAPLSLAGRIGADHPRMRIVNRGADGARLADVARQLEGNERFDAVLIMGGANDVIRYTPYEEMSAAVSDVLRRAKALAPNVIFMPMGNVGNAPFFVPPYTFLMEERSKRLHAMVRDAAFLQGAAYVNLYKTRETDPFARDPATYHARDGLHPSDAGYLSWYEELKKQAPLERRLPRR